MKFSVSLSQETSQARPKRSGPTNEKLSALPAERDQESFLHLNAAHKALRVSTRPEQNRSTVPRPDESPDLRLIHFFLEEAPDDHGRMLSDILGWTDEALEFTHNYIQWLFPLKEESGFNPEAPVLTAGVIAEMEKSPRLQGAVRRSFIRMLEFYGFAWGSSEIEPAENFEERAKNWLHASNHNHLRITRILKSLHTLGMEEEAAAFFECLKELYERERDSVEPRITETSFRFWKAAADSTI